MIPIPSNLLVRPLPYIAAVAIIAGGLFYVHQRAYNRGQAEIQAKWDKERAIQKLAYEKQEQKVAALEDQRDLLNYRIERELTPRLAASDAYGRKLAARLRHYYANGGSVSAPPEATGDPFATGGVGIPPGEVDADLGAVISACQRDAIRLNGWIEWYRGVEALENRAK